MLAIFKGLQLWLGLLAKLTDRQFNLTFLGLGPRLIWNFEVQNSDNVNDKDFQNLANTGCAREPISDIEEKSKIFYLKRTGSVVLLFIFCSVHLLLLW